jgi:hypothetical protein
MKVLQIICFIVTFLISVIFSYSADITITVPDAQVNRVRTAVLKVYPNKECNVPLSNNDVCSSLKYTDAQWFKELLVRWIKEKVYIAEEAEIKTNAVKLLPKDYDTLAQ